MNFGVFVPFISTGLAVCTYGQLAQGIAHALISSNRYTAIAMPLQNKKVCTVNEEQKAKTVRKEGAIA